MPTKETKPAVTRRYVVLDAQGKERMGKCASPSQAVARVYDTHVRVATPDDVERLIAAGVKTEDWTS